MERPNPPTRRDTLLAYLLLVFLVGNVLLFLELVSIFGIVSNIMAALTAIAAVGYMHYLWWGHSMMEQTAGEREEEEMRRRLEADQQDPFPPV